MPVVTIIVPFFGSTDELTRCLVSLDRQSIPESAREIIVVDNGSGVDLSPLKLRFPAVRWLAEAQPGSYAARNTGIRHASAPVIAFTDSDCVPASTWLAAGLDAMKKRGAPLLAGRVRYMEPPTGRLNMYESFEEHFFLLHRQEYLVARLNVSATANLFVLREVFEEVGFFATDLMHYGDGEWTKRAVAGGKSLIYDGSALVHHPRRSSFEEIRKKVRRVSGDTIMLVRREQKGVITLAGAILRHSIIDPRAHVRLVLYAFSASRFVVWPYIFGVRMSLTATIEKTKVLFGGGVARL